MVPSWYKRFGHLSFINRFSEQVTSTASIHAHYKDYIETQLRCNCFQEAMNTFKKIKYFKLDSMNPKDVEDYMGSFNSSFNEDQDDINLIYRILTTVAALSEQKCRAFHGLGKSFYFTLNKLLIH